MLENLACFTYFTVAIAALAGCADDPSRLDATEGTSENELRANSRCDQISLFVELGLANDLRATVDPKFFPNGYEVEIPHALKAFDSYGGDMVETVLGVTTTVERVWDVKPGGPVSAKLGGFSTGDRFSRQGFTAAQALFAAMTKVQPTSKTEDGWTTQTRTSAGGRFVCEVRSNGGGAKDASCTFDKLLFATPRSHLVAAADFCPSR